MFHCTAGKDRTGIAAALVLLALGVSRDVVQADYLLTNELGARPGVVESATPLEARACCGACSKAFSTPRWHRRCRPRRCQRYLTQRLRLSPAALRALATRYLQPSDTT